MYDKYIIVEKGFKNIIANDKVIGFQVKARLPYYRGLMLSMIEDLKLIVDNEVIPAYKIKLTLHGNTYRLLELENIFTDRWEFGEEGIISVEKPGGLTPGNHELDLTHMLRISYRPSLLVGKDSKVLELNKDQ